MTDKELLELAAKASGFETILYEHSDDVQSLFIRYGLTEAIWNGEKYWNPLVDDGDALRLAVSCHIEVQLTRHKSVATRIEGQAPVIVECEYADRGESIRRAIVIAAAKIGESL